MAIDNTEIEIKKVKEANQKYLDLFEKFLKEKKLSPKTIKIHLENIDFFINDFVADHYVEGFEQAHLYLEDFYAYLIQKCIWATPPQIKGVAASLKKFYKCMLENNLISKLDYSETSDSIKIGLEYCLDFYGDCY